MKSKYLEKFFELEELDCELLIYDIYTEEEFYERELERYMSRIAED